MPKPKFPYAGDAALKGLLQRYRCPAPFHVVRMRFWGEIVSPSLQASPIKTIESLWPNGLPNFEDRKEANAFFQALMGLWNNVARFQDGSLKLQKVDKVDTREALHAAGKLRVEELLDGFMHGFTGGDRQIDVPPGVGDFLTRIEKGIELLATTRNTFDHRRRCISAERDARTHAMRRRLWCAEYLDLLQHAMSSRKCRAGS